MKNILLATTALVFTAGIASAEVTFSGSGQFGVVNSTIAGTAGADTAGVNQELDLGVAMSGTTDSGMTFGQSVNVSLDGGISSETVVGSLSMNGVTFSIGDVSEADVQGGISDVGYDALGADDLAEALDGSSTASHDMAVKYAMGDFTLAYSQAFGGGTATATPNDSYAVGVKWSSGALTLGAGYLNKDHAQAVAAADGTVTSGYVKYVAGPATIQAMTSTFDSETVGATKSTAHGLSVDYAASDVLTVTVAMSDNNTTDEKGRTGLGVAYDLGGGAKFLAGYTNFNGAGAGGNADYDRSSVGFTFAF